MDKQAFKKHHFWILLVLAIILIPVALGGAVFGVGGAAEEKSKKIDNKQAALKKQQPKSQSYLAALEAEKAELQNQKDRVWKAAYGAQKGLIQWPTKLKHLNDQMDKGSLRFGDNLSVRDLDTFRGEDVYRAEYNRLPSIIAPTVFADHDWQKVLDSRFVQDFSKTPTPEEAWLALEDLCVEREVLRGIQAVNQMIAEFLPVPQPIAVPAKPLGKAKEEIEHYQEEMKLYTKEHEAYTAEKNKVDGELATAYQVKPGEFAGRFISPYWQLDLVVGRPAAGQAKAGELSFRGKLINNSNRRQNVARIDFKVWLNNTNQPKDDYAILPIQAEYLAAGASVDFSETRPAPHESALKVYKIEQKLDAHYAPVKQLMALELDSKALSHRFADKDLVAASFSQEAIDKSPPPPANPAGPAAIGAPQGGGNDATPNNHITRARYLERTEQVRRMPVAIMMIVDQGHVQDVIRALANSRLRFQNTQIQYHRFRGSITLEEPPGPVAEAPGPGNARRRNDVIDPAAIIRERQNRGGRGRPDGRRPGMAGPDSNGNPSADEENNNLVELTVYGLISLYEQYPPRAAAGQAPPVATGNPAPAPALAAPAAPVPPNVPVPPGAAAPAGNLPPPPPLTPPPARGP